jgi:hypothetical protein
MTESERTRPFYPGDNETPLESVDWKSRYEELKNRKDWDEKRDFVGIKRLGDRYHPIDPFFKFVDIPEENKKMDKYWEPTVCGTIFFLAYIGGNYLGKRPLFSSLFPGALFGLVGVGVGHASYRIRQSRARDRDAVLMHYMLLHEKEFPLIG